MHTAFALKGQFIDTPLPGELRCREGFLICEDGVVEGFYETLPERFSGIDVQDHADKLIIPGMSDLHLHAPQQAYQP